MFRSSHGCAVALTSAVSRGQGSEFKGSYFSLDDEHGDLAVRSGEELIIDRKTRADWKEMGNASDSQSWASLNLWPFSGRE